MNTITDISNELVENGIYIFPEPFANPEQIKSIIEITENELGPDG